MKQKKKIMKKAFILKFANPFIKGSCLSLLVFLSMLSYDKHVLIAADDEVQTKKTTTQRVGGLLFDVDEGVKVEQGAGGSVYVKSNREYMQEKFSDMERKFQDLEGRVTALETKQKKTSADEKSSKDDSRQVLVG